VRLKPEEKAKPPRYNAIVGRAVRHPLRTMAARENSTHVQNSTNPVVRVRSQRGNLDAKYDGGPGQTLKSLRPQFRTNYDGKKRRNTSSATQERAERSAIIYTVIESCRRREIDPYTYLRDVLTRLPNMTNRQIPEVTPEAWAKARHLTASAKAS
jgi:hypothetical protein